MGIKWALCCRKLCCWGAKDDDESPLLGCLQPSECTNQVHDPGCIKNRSRNHGKNRACTAKNSKSSSNPSTNADVPHMQEPKSIDRRQKTEKIKLNITHSSSNCLKNCENGFSKCSGLQVNSENNLKKSTGATKKIHVLKNKQLTDCNNSKPGRNEELAISSALGCKYRQYYCETSKQGQQRVKAESYEKKIRTLNTGRHGLGCSGDSNPVTFKFHATRRGQTISSKKKTRQLSKSDGDVGMWFEDEAESKSITVSLTNFRTEYFDPRQLNKTSVQDSSIGCFLLKTGDIRTRTGLPIVQQEGTILSTQNDGIYKTDQSTTNVSLVSPKNLFDDLYFGIVNFKVSYYHITKSLFVHIVDIKGMPPKGDNFFYNVIVMLSILPTTKRTKKSASVKSSDMNPYFGESFAFIVTEPRDEVLKISAYDADFQGKYNALGHAMFQLQSVTEDEMLHSYRLLREPWVDSDPGQLEVTLNYNEATEDLTVTVHRAKGLTVISGSSLNKTQSLSLERCNSFAEVAQFCGGKELNVKRTCTVINTRDPQYNSLFVFNLSSQSPHESFLVIRVILELLPKESELGRVIFGPLRFASELAPTPWGLAFSQNQVVKSWYKMYQFL